MPKKVIHVTVLRKLGQLVSKKVICVTVLKNLGQLVSKKYVSRELS